MVSSPLMRCRRFAFRRRLMRLNSAEHPAAKFTRPLRSLRTVRTFHSVEQKAPGVYVLARKCKSEDKCHHTGETRSLPMDQFTQLRSEAIRARVVRLPRLLRVSIFLAFLASTAALPVVAHSASASLAGMVVGTSGAMLPSVEVTREFAATSDSRRTTFAVTNAAVGTVVDRQFVEELPLEGRSLQALLELTPGVVSTPGGSVSLGEFGQFSVNGQRPTADGFTIDGISVSGGSPEFGSVPNGHVLMVTRSGANRTQLTTLASLQTLELRPGTFGTVVGGPIVGNRSFFFGSYEGLRLELPRVKNGNAPSREDRRGTPETTRPSLSALPLPHHRRHLDNCNRNSRYAFSVADGRGLRQTPLTFARSPLAPHSSTDIPGSAPTRVTSTRVHPRDLPS